MKRAAACGVALGLALLAGASAPASAQTLAALGDECTVAGGDSGACVAAAVAARALTGHLGVLAGLGSDVPGSASTLGRRMGNSPRVSASLRAGSLNAGLPDLSVPSGTGEASFFVPAVQVGLAVGVFDGFSPMPTVGGVLSLDLLGQVGFLFLPVDEGFAGGVRTFSLGARLGVLRESFTLPGVSVSVARRWPREVRLNGPGGGDATELTVDAAVTSVRATVGKDLLGVGVLAGVGWDDHSADVTLRVSDGAGGRAGAEGPLEGSRRTYFVGASKSFIVLQISAEAGWARGFDPVAGFSNAGFDPAGGSVFASVALRFTP